jgi:hypothetical protein
MLFSPSHRLVSLDHAYLYTSSTNRLHSPDPLLSGIDGRDVLWHVANIQKV